MLDSKKQFEAIFKTHFKFLCHFAKQYVGDLDTAQDICQKVFIQLWEKRATIDPQRSIKSYLFTAVKNKCLNHIRDHKKYQSKVLDLDSLDNLDGDDFSIEDEKDHQQELKEKIEKALNQLPEKCRTVFEMSRYQDMKYREIAEELGIAQKTVEAHMSKAMKMLRASLKDFWLLILLWLGLG